MTRRKIMAAIVLSGFIAIAILICLAFQRFHFSHQDFPRLARLQWKPADEPIATSVIIGHRGAGLPATSGEQTIGNTIAAIQKGIDSGCDWIEIDVRKTRDDQLVVFHDESIDAKTTGTGLVEELTLAELKAVDLYLDPVEKISSLEEILDHFLGRNVKWIFDIKSPGIRYSLLPVIQENVSIENAILFGEYDILLDYRNSGYLLGYTLLGKNRSNRFRVLLHQSSILRRCEELKCSYLVLPIFFTGQPMIEKATSRGFEVWSYGSDDPADARYSAGRGITGLIVDDSATVKSPVRP